jgi:hypothetical protein
MDVNEIWYWVLYYDRKTDLILVSVSPILSQFRFKTYFKTVSSYTKLVRAQNIDPVKMGTYSKQFRGLKNPAEHVSNFA